MSNERQSESLIMKSDGRFTLLFHMVICSFIFLGFAIAKTIFDVDPYVKEQGNFRNSESAIKSDCEKSESPELCHLSFDKLEISDEDYLLVENLVIALESNNDIDLISYIDDLRGFITYKDLSLIRTYISKKINFESCSKSSEFKTKAGGRALNCEPSSVLLSEAYKYESHSY